jgi:hypothetical protein
MSVELNIEIRCKECGYDLKAEFVNNRIGYPEIIVEPCNRCELTANLKALEEERKGTTCKWRKIMVDGCCYDQTECGHQDQVAYYLTEDEKYCPCCGRKIEIVK